MKNDDPWKEVDAAVATSLEERKKFVRGFARFVIDQGHGALTPSSEKPGAKPKTWQQRGREMYGPELFNQVFREELALRKRADTASAGP